jgi:putative addiction module component (TIGR02574 family)
MSSKSDLRNKVLEYIHTADDRLLHLIQELAESYQKQEGIELTEAQKAELDKRLERYKRGETEFFTWEETKAKILK